MSVIKTHKKVVGRPRKVVAKKAKPQKGSLEALDRAIAIINKHKLDFSYLKE